VSRRRHAPIKQFSPFALILLPFASNI